MCRFRSEAQPLTGTSGPGPVHMQLENTSQPSGPHLGRQDDASVNSGDPDHIDVHLIDAVGHTLGGILRERLDEAWKVDRVFARDVAERVATFARGGKRMRAQFLWWGFRACAQSAGHEAVETALRSAAGFELIQACALIHDDVMDGSTLRRGATAIHTDFDAQYGSGASEGAAPSFGSAAAILAGDLALAWADDVLAETSLLPSARDVWRSMRTEMVAGQYLDLHGRETDSRSTAMALRTASLKSALYSVERPLELGAALAGADEHLTRALCAAGRCAGLAFQLRDDLFGAFDAPDVAGTSSNGDISGGKVTYLLATARAQAEETGDDAVLDLLDSVPGRSGVSDNEIDRVRDALKVTGAFAHVEEKIRQLVEQSVEHLNDAALAPRAGHRLRELFCTAAGVSSSTAPALLRTAREVAGETSTPRLEGGDRSKL